MAGYNKKVMDHFLNPKNMGKLDNPDGIGEAGNPVCLMPGTYIYCNPEVKKIENVQVLDYIVTHSGKLSSVVKTFKSRYNGDLIGIRNFMGISWLTPDHHVLGIPLRNLKRDKSKKYKDHPIMWLHAGELKRGDVVLFPILKKTELKKYINLDIEKKKWDFKSKLLPKRIKVDKYLMRIFGYYLSEGSVRTNKCQGTLCFTFSIKEENSFVKEVLEAMRKSLGLKPSKIYKIKKRNTIHILYYSARLARFFSRELGKGSKNKKIPSWILYLPIELQKEFIRALWNGDGYLSKRAGKYVSISKRLTLYLQLILMRNRIIGSLNIEESKGMHKKSYALYIKNTTGLERLAKILGKENVIEKKLKRLNNYWFDDNYCYMIISNPKKKNYSGFVYNLNVKNNSSYCTNSLAVHNCGDVMFLYIKVNKDTNVITDIKFETMGCAAAIATSSMLTEMAKGKTVEEALKITQQDVAKELGGLPSLKMHCSNLAVDALKNAIDDYNKKKEGGVA